MSNDRRYNTMAQKRRKRRKIIFWVTIPLLVVLLTATAYASILLKKAESVALGSFEEVQGREQSPNRDDKPDPKSDNISILFMGVDDSESRDYNGATRTDALILATFNEKDKSVKLVSIPRDSYVYIPSEGEFDKINHAHVYDGVKGTIDTVEKLFDIPVDYYVKMNFYAFIDVVNALDGIEYDVPFSISEKDTEDNQNAIWIPKGQQHLSGEEALALARTRKYDSDLERGKRQQEIMKAILKKATSVGAITKYSDIIEAVGDNMTTNLTFDEMKSFLKYATEGTNLNMESLELTGTDTMIEDIYYFKLDDEAVETIQNTLKTHLEVSAADKETSTYTTQEHEETESDFVTN